MNIKDDTTMQTMTASQMAQLYGLKSSTAFNKLLTECRVLRRTDKGFILDESLQNKGYATVICQPYFLPSGIRANRKRSAWTPKGQLFIRQRLGRIGIFPAGENRDLFNN